MSNRHSNSTRKRIRVERAGSFTSGYGRGWIAMTIEPSPVGHWFHTWAEAIAFANGEATA
jgi:hypothetical protein